MGTRAMKAFGVYTRSHFLFCGLFLAPVFCQDYVLIGRCLLGRDRDHELTCEDGRISLPSRQL